MPLRARSRGNTEHERLWNGECYIFKVFFIIKIHFEYILLQNVLYSSLISIHSL